MALIIQTDLQSGIFAVGNPITLKLTNYDGYFDDVTEGTIEMGEPYTGKCILSNGDPAGGEFNTLLTVGMMVQINGNHLNGEYEVTALGYQMDYFVIDADYNALYDNDYGSIVILSDPPALYVETQIYHDNTLMATTYNSRLSDYLIKIDFSNFLKVLFSKDNDSRYLYINYLDTNLSSYFKYRYREHRVGVDFDPLNEYTAFSSNIYVIYSAMQLGDHGGGDLRDYSIKVIPAFTDEHTHRRFLSKFEKPRFFKGYPMDVSFLWWENVLQPEVVVRTDRMDILGDLTYTTMNENLENNLGYGLHRCWIKEPVDPSTANIEFALKAFDNSQWKYCINPITIEYDSECYQNGIYLCWLNTLGGWDHWLFHTSYNENIDIEGSVVMKRFITDWENQGTQKDLIRKKVIKSLSIGADNLRRDQIIGLRDLLYSTRVMMLMNAEELVEDRTNPETLLNSWTYEYLQKAYGNMTALVNENDNIPNDYAVGMFLMVNGGVVNGIYEILDISSHTAPGYITIRLAWAYGQDVTHADTGQTDPIVYNVEPIWHTVIVMEDSWKLYDAKYDRSSIELEIELPDINIQ